MAVLSTSTFKPPIPAKLHWKTLRVGQINPNLIPSLFGVLAPSVPVFEIAKQMGVGLYYLPNESRFEKVDGLLQIKGGQPQIYINNAFPTVRQRFTVAHELGHLLLHPLEDGKVLFRSSSLSRTAMQQEREADTFASKLLMPENMVRTYAHLGTVHELARAFDVSLAAMSIRVREIFT